MGRLLAGLAILVALVGGAYAASPSFSAVRDDYFAARDGKMSLDAAAQRIKAFLETTPRHPVATAFLGSIKAKMAKEAFFPFTKLAYLNQGTDLLDDAVARLDEAEVHERYDGRLDILMVSGLTNANIPVIFGRRQFAERDLQRVTELPSFARVPADSKAGVYAWLAVIYAARDKAAADGYLAKARAEDRAIADAIWDKAS